MGAYDEAREFLRTQGRVPIFPLPGVMLFPHAVLPLHIFEPRYRRMTVDALAGPRLIAMALLKPGWERGYHGNPEVFPIACAGFIEAAAPLPDGRYNLSLRGLARVEILDFVQDTPYRIARVRLKEERFNADGPDVESDKRRLLAACTGLLQEITGRPEQVPLMDQEIPFAAAVNTLCQSLALDPPTRQRLLALDDVRERCRALVDLLNRRWREISLERATGEEGSVPEGDVH